MKSVEEFFKKFKEAQESALFQHGLSSTDSDEIELDSTLTLAIQRGWHIAPVLARSKYFLASALAGYPTRDVVQLRHWVRQYSECGCNWVVETGERSGVLVLEFTYDIGREMVRYLCGNDWSWRTTLQFTDHNARFVCFRYSGQQIRVLGNDFPGVYIHLGNCLLIPPSRTSELTNRLTAGGFRVTAESRIDRPCGRYCCFSFVTLNAFVLTPSLLARRGLKGKNKCYRRLKAWGLLIPDRRL